MAPQPPKLPLTPQPSHPSLLQLWFPAGLRMGPAPLQWTLFLPQTAMALAPDASRRRAGVFLSREIQSLANRAPRRRRSNSEPTREKARKPTTQWLPACTPASGLGKIAPQEFSKRRFPAQNKAPAPQLALIALGHWSRVNMHLGGRVPVEVLAISRRLSNNSPLRHQVYAMPGVTQGASAHCPQCAERQPHAIPPQE